MAICTLIQWLDVSDKDVTNPSKYRVVKQHQNINPPVIGLDSDLEYFVERTPYAFPDEDTRLVIVQATNLPTENFDTEFPTLRQWVYSYTIIDRDADDKKESVEEAENFANSTVFPTTKQLKYLTMYAVLVRRQLLGLNITTAQADIMDKVESKAAKIWQNHVVSLNKKATIDANNNVDLDSNWETIDPEDEINS